MSGMLLLMFVQSLFQFGGKMRKLEGYYGEKNYLDMSFDRQSLSSSEIAISDLTSGFTDEEILNCYPLI